MAESKMMAHERLSFTIETPVGWRDGRRCQMAGTAMFAYGRSPTLAHGSLWSDRSTIGKRNDLPAVKRIVTVALRWLWVADGGAVLSGNAIAGRQTQCNGGFQVALGCRWCRECHCRFPCYAVLLGTVIAGGLMVWS